MAKAAKTNNRGKNATTMQQYYLDICDRFLLARMENKFVQSEWAKSLRLTESYVKAIELRRFTPNLFAIKELHHKFGYSYQWIIDGVGEKKVR